MDHNKLWKILKETGILGHLTCLLRNLYAGQEATVRTGHETTDWFQIGKRYIKAIYCHCVYLTYMQSISCKMPGWMKHKVESRLLGEISVTSDKQMTPPLWKKAKRMNVKEESEKVGLTLNIQKMLSPITSWHPVPSLHGKQMGKQ